MNKKKIEEIDKRIRKQNKDNKGKINDKVKDEFHPMFEKVVDFKYSVNKND